MLADDIALVRAMRPTVHLDHTATGRCVTLTAEQWAACQRLAAECERLDIEADQLIRERDFAEGWADKLASGVGNIELIGEHSNLNSPWERAYEHLTPFECVQNMQAEIGRLKAECERLQGERDHLVKERDDYADAASEEAFQGDLARSQLAAPATDEAAWERLNIAGQNAHADAMFNGGFVMAEDASIAAEKAELSRILAAARADERAKAFAEAADVCDQMAEEEKRIYAEPRHVFGHYLLANAADRIRALATPDRESP